MKRRGSLAAAIAVVIVSACGGKVTVDLGGSSSAAGGAGVSSSSISAGGGVSGSSTGAGGGVSSTSTTTSAGGGVSSSSSSGGLVDAGVIDAGSGGGVPEGGVIDAGVTGPGTALRTSIASASYVRVPGLAIPHDFTLEIWAQPDSLDGADQMLLSKEQSGVGQNQFRFGLTGGRLYFMMCDAALQGDMWTPDEGYALVSPPLPAEVWTHAAVVKTGNAFILYVNGVKVASHISPVDLVHTGTFPFEIAARLGGDGVSSDSVFGGVVDEIRVWNIARPASEIAADMGKTIPPTHPEYGSLVAYYRLDDGSGAIASDTKGMYPGDLVNGPTWVPSTAPTGY